MSDLRTQGRVILDRTADRLRGGHVDFGMESLRNGLDRLRTSMEPDEWDRFVTSDVRRHPLASLVVESPFTRRALEKPRGFAGDAVMLDYAYGATDLPEGTSPLGRAIYRWEYQTQSCRAVRARRDMLTEFLEDVAAERKEPRVLSVACGHLREVEDSTAVAEERLGALFALDQDPDSLAVVEAMLGDRGVRPVRQSAVGLIRGKTTFTDLDFVYVSGLYDYLGAPLATALTRTLFDYLVPGGRLLIANLTADLSDIGYMEACMDWRLIYRSEGDLEALTAQLDDGSIADQGTFRDASGVVAFMELRKA